MPIAGALSDRALNTFDTVTPSTPRVAPALSLRDAAAPSSVRHLVQDAVALLLAGRSTQPSSLQLAFPRDVLSQWTGAASMTGAGMLSAVKSDPSSSKASPMDCSLFTVMD